MSVCEVGKAGWSYVLDEPVRILVADDDPTLCEFASVHLATPTATIVTAPNGAAALEALRDAPFDLAVLDIEMPELNGFELLARIRADSALRQLPVMMLTGHDDMASIDRAYRLGANAFSSKPVKWRLLSYQIRYVLRSSYRAGWARPAEFPSRCSHNESRKTQRGAVPRRRRIETAAMATRRSSG